MADVFLTAHGIGNHGSSGDQSIRPLSPGLDGSLVLYWRRPVWPGFSVRLDGDTLSTAPKRWSVNSRCTTPLYGVVPAVLSRRNTTAFHVPATGLRTSTCP